MSYEGKKDIDALQELYDGLQERYGRIRECITDDKDFIVMEQVMERTVPELIAFMRRIGGDRRVYIDSSLDQLAPIESLVVQYEES